MKNTNISIVMLLFAFFCTIGCSKEGDLEASLADEKDWMVVPDLPGEYNELRYKLYRDYGITLLCTDTLGMKYLGKDAYGKEIHKTVLYEMGYNIFNVAVQEFSLFYDSELATKALKAIEKWVCPNLPTVKGFSPQIIFLVDSLQFRKNFKQTPYNAMVGNFEFYTGGIRGVTISQIPKLKDLSIDSEEWRLKMGYILAKRAMDWIYAQEDLKEDIVTFKSFASYIGQPNVFYYRMHQNTIFISLGKITEVVPEYQNNSFLQWDALIENCEPAPDPIPAGFRYGLVTGYYPEDVNNDLVCYISYYYLYKDRMAEFDERYRDYPKILGKMRMIEVFMEKYEKVAGVK